MIDRYTLPAMGRVWSEAHKYELWCRVETLVLEANARAGTVPAEAVGPVRAAPPPTPEAVAEVEAVTEHDVIAFLTAWADNTEPRSAAAYVHYGMTSSDLLDTALALQLVEATDLILEKATGWSRCCATTGSRTGARSARAGPTASTPNRTCGGTGWPTSRSPARSRDRLAGPGRGRGRHAVRSGRHLLQHRPVDRGRGDAGARAPRRRRRHPGGDARRHRRVGVRAGHPGHGLRGDRARGQARPADRGARARRAVPDRAEGLFGDAAQEEPDPVRADRRAGPRGAVYVRRSPRAYRCGTSATSRTPAWSGSRCRTRPSAPTTCCT